MGGESENFDTRSALSRTKTGELNPAHALRYLSPVTRMGLLTLSLRCSSGVASCSRKHCQKDGVIPPERHYPYTLRISFVCLAITYRLASAGDGVTILWTLMWGASRSRGWDRPSVEKGG
jgi:hypothetical protein